MWPIISLQLLAFLANHQQSSGCYLFHQSPLLPHRAGVFHPYLQTLRLHQHQQDVVQLPALLHLQPQSQLRSFQLQKMT